MDEVTNTLWKVVT